MNYPVGKVLKHMTLFIEKSINKQLASKDLSATQGFVLWFLSSQENHTVAIKEIEKEFDTAQSTVFGIIHRLEKKGFVTSFMEEGRTKFVRATDEGVELSDYIKTCTEASEQMVFAHLTETEQLIFLELLKKIDQNI